MKETNVESMAKVDGLDKISTRCIWLPLYEESKEIVEKYLTDITFLHHVVHIPSVHSNVNELYESLNAKRPVKLGHVSLLLAIWPAVPFPGRSEIWADQHFPWSGSPVSYLKDG